MRGRARTVAAAVGGRDVPGGLLIIGVLAALLRLQRGFRAYDAAHPTP